MKPSSFPTQALGGRRGRAAEGPTPKDYPDVLYNVIMVQASYSMTKTFHVSNSLPSISCQTRQARPMSPMYVRMAEGMAVNRGDYYSSAESAAAVTNRWPNLTFSARFSPPSSFKALIDSLPYQALQPFCSPSCKLRVLAYLNDD
jgi:hypothetical protein